MECGGIFGEYSRDYLQMAQIASVSLVALFGALIAFQQMQTARNKLKFDLFERRMKVFDATRNFCGYVIRTADMSDDVLREYFLSIVDAEFLFDKRVSEYLEHVRKQGIELQWVNKSLARNDANRSEHIERSTMLIKWFSNQLEETRRRLGPFLQLRH